MRRVPVRLLSEIDPAHPLSPEPFLCSEIARGLAVNPNTGEVDERVAERFLADIKARRNEFSENDLWIGFSGNRRVASIPSIVEADFSVKWLTLNATLEMAREQTGDPDWDFPHSDWRYSIMMAPNAARRYIKLAATTDAERILRELGLEDQSSPPADDDCRESEEPSPHDNGASASRALTETAKQSEVYHTGTAGRPSSWDRIQAECRRRYEAGERHPNDRTNTESPAKWAPVLISWLKAEHDGAPVPTAKALTNKLGDLLRELKRKTASKGPAQR